MKKILICCLLALFALSTKAQIQRPVKWSYAAKKVSNDEAVIYLKATIDNGWHIYSAYIKGEGPVKTSVVFTPSKDFKLLGKLVEPKPLTKYEDSFDMDVSYFEGSVIFQQKVKLSKAATVINGRLEYMVCDAHQCLPPETVEFSVPIK